MIILIAICALLLAAIVVIIVFASRIGRLNGEKMALEGQLKAQDETYKALDAQRAQQPQKLQKPETGGKAGEGRQNRPEVYQRHWRDRIENE